jgi:predicted dehydrogenase
MEHQMRNWYYFTWLSGDFNVEQHVHFLDTCAWLMKGQYPVKAWGTGGRQQRTAPEYGHIYDHHAIGYEFANGVKLFSTCRQYAGSYNESNIQVIGSRGDAHLSDKRQAIGTKRPWEYADDPKNPHDKFQAEHDEMFASIRRGKPINNGDYMAKSTLLAIMGRMATYTGQAITWEQALNSQESLMPEKLDFGPFPTPPVAIPGKTKFV